MQDLYSISSRRAINDFEEKLIAEKIPCQTVAGLAKVPTNTNAMKCVATRGSADDGLLGREIPIRGTILELAVHEGLAVAVSDVQNDPRISADIEHLVTEETRSLLCVPFAFEGRNFGAVELVNRTMGDTWRQREIHLVSYIGNHLAEYIAQSLPSTDDDFEADFAEEKSAKTKRSTSPPKPKAKPKAKATKGTRTSKKPSKKPPKKSPSTGKAKLSRKAKKRKKR